MDALCFELFFSFSERQNLLLARQKLLFEQHVRLEQQQKEIEEQRIRLAQYQQALQEQPIRRQQRQEKV